MKAHEINHTQSSPANHANEREYRIGNQNDGRRLARRFTFPIILAWIRVITGQLIFLSEVACAVSVRLWRRLKERRPAPPGAGYIIQ